MLPTYHTSRQSHPSAINILRFEAQCARKALSAVSPLAPALAYAPAQMPRAARVYDLLACMYVCRRQLSHSLAVSEPLFRRYFAPEGTKQD